MNRYLATYVFRADWVPDTRVFTAKSRELALEAAKAWRDPNWRPELTPRVYMGNELPVSADHNGSTHGD